jgi:ferric-dicitrate binding protein FerR (iron transport regulator)
MITQDEALLLLSARVDGELTPEQERELDAWLSEHADGRIIAEAFQMQDAEMRHAFEARREAAVRNAERVAAQLPTPVTPVATPGPRLRGRRFWAILPPIAAAAVLAVIGFYWLRHQPPASSPTKEMVYHGENLALDSVELLIPRVKPAVPEPVVTAAGEKLTTRMGEKRRTVLTDGTVLYLNQNTSLEVASDRLVKLDSGQIFVEAAPADATAGRGAFQIETAQHKLTALGTKFSVVAAGDALSLAVTQGKVQFDDAIEPVVAGQIVKANLKKLDEPVPAKRASSELDWTRDLMIAADSPLVPAGKYDGGALVAVDPYGQEAKLSLVKYHIDVHIEDGFARTTIDQTYFNY